MRWRRKKIIHEIAPDEIFLDSSNLPEYNAKQFEGRVTKPVAARSIITVGIVFLFVLGIFTYRAYSLEVKNGPHYADISQNNTLAKHLLFATRGLIYDRNGTKLAWNTAQITATSTEETYALRSYIPLDGFAHVIGFVQYPKADKKGTWWRHDYTGVSGIELSYNDALSGTNGYTMVERDARGKVQRENIVVPPKNGEDLTLSIDAEVQDKLYSLLLAHAEQMGFRGGAGVIMDVRTGELLAITSFPEYDHQAFADGENAVVAAASSDAHTPLLNRAISGLYTPGSIVKPIFAAAALSEGIISPDKQIQSVGQLTLPNPYDPAHPSIFRDWTVHGWIDMRTALAVSSDEYFYTIGGGFGSQKGLGIQKLDEYAKRFGLSQPTGIDLKGEQNGVIPTPAWKAQVFGAGDPWRIGDTYHTAIGQYGFQVTPIQAVRFVSAIANGGKLLTPQLIASSTPQYTMVGIPDEELQIVREGMRMAVTSPRPDATVKFFNISSIQLAAKTGTAQLGSHNQYMNSWSIGFWPADNPHYAYAVVLEQAKAGTASGAAPGLLPFFQWLIANKPQYLN